MRAHLPVLVVIAMLVASVAAAQSSASVPAPRAQTSDQGVEYRQLIEEALVEFAASRWHEARSLFELAHRLRASARTLRGLGLTSFEQGQYVRAAGELRAALEHHDNPLTEKQRAEVQGALAKAKRFIGVVQVEIVPADAELFVDGVPSSSRTLELDIGEHALQVRANDHDPARQSVNVEGGGRYAVRFELTPQRPSRPQLGLSQAPPDRHAPTQASGPTALQWTALCASGAVAVGGGVLLGLAAAAKHEVEAAPDGTDLADVQGAKQRAPVYGMVGGVLLGTGLAGAAASVVWMLVSPASTARERPQLSVSGTTLQLHASF